jgi:hypothetical protein
MKRQGWRLEPEGAMRGVQDRTQNIFWNRISFERSDASSGANYFAEIHFQRLE